jgi:hypothetical protein
MLKPTGQSVVRYVIWWYRIVVAGSFGFFALLLLSLLVSADHLAAALFDSVALVLMVAVIVRACRCASIELRDTEIVIHGLLRTRRIAWTSVRAVGVTRGSSAAFVRWRVPYFKLDDGSTVRADEIRALRAPSAIDDVVAEAQRRLGI